MNLKSQLDNIDILNKDGSVENLGENMDKNSKKKEIRKEILKHRRSLTEEEIRSGSHAIAEKSFRWRSIRKRKLYIYT
ncbi:MAG: hypothetical protein ACLR2E_04275 [Lachnospiraceae bacterium]